MWIAAIGDRLYWLLPDTKYVVGRATSNNDGKVDIPIDNDTSVSRKHLTLQVRHLNQNAVLHPSVRSDLAVTDLNSRYGTRVDGEILSSGSTTTVPQVPSGMLSIKLGRESTRVRLKWSLYVVTYLTGQSGDAHETLFHHALGLARAYDFKLTSHLVSATQVLVVTGKATSSLYYALTQQIPVVNTQFFEALRENAEQISRKGTLSSVLPKCDSFYADPAYKPNARRKEVLTGYTLQIPDHQYEEIMKAIVLAAGGQVSPSGTILLVASHDDPHLASSTQYILGNTLFTLIMDARKLETSDIFTSGAHSYAGVADRNRDKSTAPRKLKRTNLLDIMTSQETSQVPEPKRPKLSQSKEATAPAARTASSTAVTSHFTVATPSVGGNASNEGQNEEMLSEQQLPPSNKNRKVKFSSTEPLKSSERPGSQRSSILRKGEGLIVSEVPPPEKGDNQNVHKDGKDARSIDKDWKDGKDASSKDKDWDFRMLADLVSITSELPVNRARRPSPSVIPCATGKPNFKGFRPKPHGDERFTSSESHPSRSRKSVRLNINMPDPHIAESPAASNDSSIDISTDVDTGNNASYLSADDKKKFGEEAPDIAASGSPSRKARYDVLSTALRTQNEEEDDEFGFSFQ